MSYPLPVVPRTNNETELLKWRNEVKSYLTDLAIGPSTNTDGAIVLWDGTDSKLLKEGTAAEVLAILLASTAAGDIPYFSAANVLARLAIGTANHKLFVNTDGTIPEYAVGIKIGTFTYDISTASGTQAITGIGFSGSHVFFLGAINTSTGAFIGIDDGGGTNHYRIRCDLTANTWHTAVSSSLIGFVDSSNYNIGYVSAWSADGFTLTWSKTGSPTGTLTVYYLVFR